MEVMIKLYTNSILAEADTYVDTEIELKSNSVLYPLILKHEHQIPGLENLVADLYLALYTYNPVLVDEKEIDPKYLLNYSIISGFLETDTYEAFRSHTQGNYFVTQDSLVELVKTLAPVLIQIHKKYKDDLQELDALQYTLDLEASIPNIQSRDQAKEALKSKYKNELIPILSSPMYELVGRTYALTNTINEWGLDTSNSFQLLDYRTKLDLVYKLQNSNKIKEISKISGKLKELYRSVGKRSTRLNDRIDGISFGNKISRALPQELALLTSSSGANLFYKKYTDSNIGQHNYSGRTSKGKGPIVVLIDSSGSMCGNKEVWSKAVALALLETARDQKRDFFAVHFAGPTNPMKLKTQEFGKNDFSDISKKIEMLEYFHGGGTDFETPLDRARLKIQNDPNYHSADIIMISDGNSAVSDSWLKDFLSWKHNKDVSIQSILIPEGISATTSTLVEFSDALHIIDDVQTMEADYAVLKIFKALTD